MRAVSLAAAVVLAATLGKAQANGPALSRGEFVYRVAGCENCHTDRDNKGKTLAGGRKIVTPLGTFYSPNITPDPETGIGRWSEQAFIRAVRDGVRPDGSHYYPSFPYTSYTKLTDDDVRALWSYLRKVPPVREVNRPHELPWYLQSRSLLSIWKGMFFNAGRFAADAEKSSEWNRGAYLATAMGHCGECHTPRNPLGGPRQSLTLAGSASGAEGEVVPNITPDKKTGIGKWRASELAQYLESGMTPDGDFAGSLMAEMIDNGFKHLSASDRQAVAAWLLAQPPVEHAVRKPKAKKQKDEFG